MGTPPEKEPPVNAATEEPLQILREACAARSPVRILYDDAVIDATFESVSEDRVTLYVLENVALAPAPLSLCCVTFVVAQRTCAFVGTIHDFQPNLVLRLPRRIATAEGRMAVRVPVAADSGLSVRVKPRDNVVRVAEAIDLSVSGICLRFDERAWPLLRVGSPLDVELRLGENVVRTRGIVRRRAGKGRYGIFFPESVVEGSLQPPEPLAHMVQALERAWRQTTQGSTISAGA